MNCSNPPIVDENKLDRSALSKAAITEAAMIHVSAVDNVAEGFWRSAAKKSSPGLVSAFTHVRKMSWMSTGVSFDIRALQQEISQLAGVNSQPAG